MYDRFKWLVGNFSAVDVSKCPVLDIPPLQLPVSTLKMFFPVDLLLFVSSFSHVLNTQLDLRGCPLWDNPLQLPLPIPFRLHLLYLYLYLYSCLIYICFCYPAVMSGPQSVDAIWVNFPQFSSCSSEQQPTFYPNSSPPNHHLVSQQTQPQRPRNTQNCQRPSTSNGIASQNEPILINWLASYKQLEVGGGP